MISLIYFIGLCLGLAFCQHLPTELLLNGNVEFIELSHPIDNDTVVWPGSDKYRITNQYASAEDYGFWYAVSDFCIGEHAGTHFDAPYHFDETGMMVGAIPLEHLITSLLVLDVSKETNDNPNFILRKEHVETTLVKHLKDSTHKTTILFNFGWGKYYNDTLKYFGSYDKNSLKFPGIGSDVVEFIVQNYKNVVGVGLDTASIDPGSDLIFPTHKSMAKNGLYNIENANIPNGVPESGCVAIVMPMKLSYGTGAPLRLSAICSKERHSGSN